MADDKAKWDQLVGKAKAFVTAVSSGDLATATTQLDDQMKQAMPGDGLLQVWASVETQAGKYQGEAGQVRTSVEQQYHCVYLGAKFEKAGLFVKVVYEGDKVAGLQFVPQAP
jgi:hypothetical protein